MVKGIFLIILKVSYLYLFYMQLEIHRLASSAMRMDALASDMPP
jgi:hypothetical protein